MLKKNPFKILSTRNLDSELSFVGIIILLIYVYKQIPDRISYHSEIWSRPFPDSNFTDDLITVGQGISEWNRNVSDAEFQNLFKPYKIYLSSSGRHTPIYSMIPDEHMCIIVPFRNRTVQLRVFLLYMHSFLIQQRVSYNIIVVEQTFDKMFNRAFLFNVGFLQSNALNLSCNCFVFHDVDTLPASLHTLYTCLKSPSHYSSYMERFSYRLPYERFFGGVFAATPEHILKINGFPNRYHGWGGEDDDIRERFRVMVGNVHQKSIETGKYYSMQYNHEREKKEFDNRFVELKKVIPKMRTDGLSSIEYKIHKITSDHSHVHILTSES